MNASEWLENNTGWYRDGKRYEGSPALWLVAEWMEKYKSIKCKEYKQDIQFLGRRQLMAGSIDCLQKRDTGTSANSIVAIAYGIISLQSQVLPFDYLDMMACENMWQKLPEHRKCGDALKAMERARSSHYLE